MLNKDNFTELIPVNDEKAFYIEKPSAKEYYDVCNEFRWVILYISKGLCRREIYYAKYIYDGPVMEMFIKMLNWKVGIDNNWNVSTGANSKYLKRYLSAEEMERFQGIFPDGTYEDIWKKMYLMYDYFAENAKYVAEKSGYYFDEKETNEVRAFMKAREEDRQFISIF